MSPGTPLEVGGRLPGDMLQEEGERHQEAPPDQRAFLPRLVSAWAVTVGI